MKPYYVQKSYRWITAILGFLLMVVGGIFMVADTPGLLVTGIGVVLLILGGDAILSAARSKESFLSKIGPLP